MTTMDENTKKEVAEIVHKELARILGSDRYIFTRDLELANGRNIQVGRSVGTSIGTATDQKLSVYGETPVVQAGAISTPSSAGGVYSQSQVQSVVDAVNSIITAIKNFGVTA
jgi:hypothetical protein